jgi:hypothetical protein
VGALDVQRSASASTPPIQGGSSSHCIGSGCSFLLGET